MAQNGVFKKMSLPQQVMQCKAHIFVGWKNWCWASWTHCAWFRVWVCGGQGKLFFGLASVHLLPWMDANTQATHGRRECIFSFCHYYFYYTFLSLSPFIFFFTHLIYFSSLYFYHSYEVNRTSEKNSRSHMDSTTHWPTERLHLDMPSVSRQHESGKKHCEEKMFVVCTPSHPIHAAWVSNGTYVL